MEERHAVNRLADIRQAMDALKEEQERIEGYFIARAEEELANTKRRSVAFAGDSGVRVTVTNAASVKIIYPALLRTLLPYSDIVREDTAYRLTAGGKRLVGGLCRGEYLDCTVDDVLRQICADSAQLPQLTKKVRGKSPETDRRHIQAITGCTREEAEEAAYLVAEAAVWQEYDKLCQAMNLDGRQRAELMATLNAAVIVEETPRICVETE